jgi:transcription initiation factor TFIIIB Brf1 subunit/transcription initiation factor TFIIB
MTTRYEHLFSGENARTMCNDCGCNVIDQRLHDKFHEGSVVETMQKIIDENFAEVVRRLRTSMGLG